jgi:lysozyme
MNRNELIKQLIEDEGLRLFPYKCSAGYLTIGVGRNLITNWFSSRELDELGFTDRNLVPADIISKLKQTGITKDQTIFLLNNDIDSVISQLKSSLSWFDSALDIVQQVLSNMCFNLGIGTLLTFKNTLKLIKNGNYDIAATEMLKSKWASQVGFRAIRLSEKLKSIK